MGQAMACLPLHPRLCRLLLQAAELRCFLLGVYLAVLGRAMQLAESGYARSNAMRNYLDVHLIQKEPLDILYFTPSLTCVINADDRSANVIP